METTSFDLIKIMTEFTSLSDKEYTRSKNSQCRLLQSSFKRDTTFDLSTSLLRYILKNPSRYGYRPLTFLNQRVACFLVSSSPEFSQRKTEKTHSIVYTLIIYPSNDESSPLSYFLLLTRNDERIYTQNVSSSSGDLLLEYIDSGFYLGDILKSAEKTIDSLIDQVFFI